MKKVILTKGLPASGKSTWARKTVKDHPNTYKRVNKDDLRLMMDDRFSKDSEKLVLDVRDAIILKALEDDKHVIVDDTNLAPKHEAHIRQLVRGLAEVFIQEFDVPVEECIERDSKRQNPVGAKVIRNMYNQFIRKIEVYNEDTSLPHAIIVDIDGTLAKMGDRSPYDWSKVDLDTINEPVRSISNGYAGPYKNVIIMSGRDGSCREATIKWLQENGVYFDLLLMRHEGNNEKDSIIKKRMFEENVRGRYYVDYVLDDRDQVVALWRSMGLTCLQVAEGDF